MSEQADKATPSTTPQKLTGSCHCGFIKYRVTVALTDPPTAGRCNCTICVKQGFTGIQLPNRRDDFELLSPSSFGEMSDYQTPRSEGKIHKYFCGRCGVHVVGEGEFEYQGQLHRFFSVNVTTIDQPQDGFDLSRLKIRYVDGLNNNWGAGPKDVPWPGGAV